jgi:hypothetical protein
VSGGLTQCLGDEMSSTDGSAGPTIRFDVPLRRWVPLAFAGTVITAAGTVSPFAVGHARWVNYAVWGAVWVIGCWSRVRWTSVELTPDSMVIRSGRKAPRVIPVAEIAAITPVRVGYRTVLLVRTDLGVTFALPTPMEAWWFNQPDRLFAEEAEKVQRWFIAKRLPV